MGTRLSRKHCATVKTDKEDIGDSVGKQVSIKENMLWLHNRLNDIQGHLLNSNQGKRWTRKTRLRLHWWLRKVSNENGDLDWDPDDFKRVYLSTKRYNDDIFGQQELIQDMMYLRSALQEKLSLLEQQYPLEANNVRCLVSQI